MLPYDVGSGGGGKNTILSDDKLRDAISRTDLQDNLNSFRAEETAVSTDDQRGPFGIDRAKDGLDKVLRVVLILFG